MNKPLLSDQDKKTMNSDSVKAKILCVDDEISILNILTRGLSDDFEVLSALNGPQALELLKKNPDIIVILSDQKMKDMTGTEFLAEAQKINPDPIRIMVTAYTEVQLIMDSINKGNVYKFILKPFEMEDIKVTTMRAIEHYHHKKAYEKAYNDLKSAQDQLIRTERMSALGRLMSSISHELGTPISNINQAAILAQMEWEQLADSIREVAVIKTESDLIEFKQKHDPAFFNRLLNEFDGIIRTIKNSSQFAKEIINDLRGISRMDDSEWMQIDIHQLIDRAIHLMKAQYKYHIEFHKAFGDCPLIFGLPGPLTQVFLNLIQNAAQAISDKGNIWITTRRQDDFVSISVKDDGLGIPPENMSKIFDFGYTTKNEEDGTGLGLTISSGIIEKHHGKIIFTSQTNIGSEFIVTLPIRRNQSIDSDLLNNS